MQPHHLIVKYYAALGKNTYRSNTIEMMLRNLFLEEESLAEKWLWEMNTSEGE